MMAASAVGSALLQLFWCAVPVFLIIRFRVTGFFAGVIFFWFAPIALVHLRFGVPLGSRFGRAYGEWFGGGWVLSLLYNGLILAVLVLFLRLRSVVAEARRAAEERRVDDGETGGDDGTESS